MQFQSLLVQFSRLVPEYDRRVDFSYPQCSVCIAQFMSLDSLFWTSFWSPQRLMTFATFALEHLLPSLCAEKPRDFFLNEDFSFLNLPL